jgi:hypothetical protein
MADIKKWGVSKETQSKRDRKAAEIRIKEVLDKHKKGKKATKGEMDTIFALTNQHSTHRSPRTYPRFIKEAKSDMGAFDKVSFDKEMKKQKRK